MSHTPQRSPAKGKRSWKQRGTVEGRGAPAESRKIGRWILSIALPILVGLFVWLLFRNTWGQRHLVVVPILSTDQLTLPPKPFVREDMAAFEGVPNASLHAATGVAYDEASFDAYLTRIASLPKNPKEVLILYLSAHGLTDETGRPFLACSDFDRAGNSGRYDVQRLLDRIGKSRARLKLIVLDAGRLDYDPRLGIIGNEFAAQVADLVKQLPPQELWVMLPAGGSQVSAVSYADQQTAFGKAVADALHGHADQPPDDNDSYVDLREFTDYVTGYCQNWFGSSLPGYQTPVLLRAGQGIEPNASRLVGSEYRLIYCPSKPAAKSKAEPPEDKAKSKPKVARPSNVSAAPTKTLALAQPSTSSVSESNDGKASGVPSAAAAASQPDEAKATETAGAPQADAEVKKPADPSSDKTSAAQESTTVDPAKPEAKPATTAAPAKSKPQPSAPKAAGPITLEKQLFDELRQLWELRDMLQDRTATAGSSPIDFAPHLWRETEAWILYFETRLRCGRLHQEQPDELEEQADEDASEPDEQDLRLLLREMQTLRENLQRLSRAIEESNAVQGTDEQSIGSRLIAAWTERYLPDRKGDDEQFERKATSELKQAREAVRGLHDLLYRSVYYVRWFGHANTTLANPDADKQLIEAFLNELGSLLAELRQLERSQLAASERSRLVDFIDRQEALAEQQQELAALLTKAQEDALADPNEHFAQRRIEELLSTPLLSSSNRMKLLQALHRSATADEHEVWVPPPPPSFRQRLELDWTRVRACLQLETALLRLVDKTTAATAERFIREADEEHAQRQPAQSTVEGDFWDKYRNAVRVIKTFYSDLPSEIPESFALHLVDPRDGVKKYELPEFRIDLERPPEIHLQPVASVLRLDKNLTARLSVTMAASSEALLDTRVAVVNDEGLLVFEPLPESAVTSAEGGLFRKTISWQVSGRSEAIREGKNATTVRLVAKYAGREAQSSVAINLPQPDRVDVFFERLGVPASSGGQSEGLTLHLLPNRNTTFICFLANQHHEPKTVDVALYAIVPRPQFRTAVGKLDEELREQLFDKEDQVFIDTSAVKLIAKSAKPIELPPAAVDQPNAERRRIELAVPTVPPLAAPPPQDKAAPAAPPPAAPEPIPAYGLVLKVTDVSQRSGPWIKWIELSPLAPREYLQADIGYDQRQQQIVATFYSKVLDDRGRPRLPPGAPITIQWDPTGADLPEQGKQRLADHLDGAAGKVQAVLRADAPADGKSRDVRIAVDGYPRAFLFRVPCRRDPAGPAFLPGSDLARELTSIRIESLTVPDQKIVFHYPPHIDRPPPEKAEEGKEQPVQHINLQFREPAIFNAPAETLLVNLEADAPLDAFTNSTDWIRVRLRETDETIVIRAIRDLRAFFVGCGADGVLELSTKVDDLRVPLHGGTLENVETVVDAEIKFRDVEDVAQAIVQIDGDNAVIRRFDFPSVLEKNSKATGVLRVDDRFGVKRVTWAFSKNGSRIILDSAANQREVTVRRNESGLFLVPFEVDTKDLPVGRYLLLAKVEDLVGHESKIESREFLIVETPVVPKNGEIRGVIKAGRSSVNGFLFDLTIEGGEIGTRAVPVRADGSFLIPDLPPGEYTLKPKGSVGGKEVKEKEFKAKPTDPRKAVVIELNVAG